VSFEDVLGFMGLSERFSYPSTLVQGNTSDRSCAHGFG
jgi:hypothetical protein